MWRDESCLLDMLQAARQILEYTAGLQQSAFLSSRKDQDAVLLQFAVLGEATKRVPAEFRTAHPEVSWRKITGFRDVIVHDYFNVDFNRVWRIACEDIPPLIAALEPLVPPETP